MIVVRITPPFSHFKLRAIEWGLAGMLFSIGTVIIHPDFQFSNSPSLVEMARVGNETFWGLLCMLFGGLRILALWVNGTWKKSPYVRALTALVSSLVWIQITLGLATQPLLSFGIAIFPFLTLLDWFSLWRAMDDADTYHREEKAPVANVA